MGADKCALVLGGRSLLQRAVDALEGVAGEIVVVGAPGRAPPPVTSQRQMLHASDAIADAGPLVGVLAGLEATSAEVALVVGCDLPLVQPALLRLLAERALAGARFVVPVHEGEPQLLCSAWRRDALPVLRAHVAAGDRAVASMVEALDAELLPPEAWRAADAAGRSFVNVNTPEDLERARAALEGASGG
jgi:molybdopterin-guanine dinucleotide biosynthesis protein A